MKTQRGHGTMKTRKRLVLGVLLTAVVLAAAVWVWQCQRERIFTELIPFPAESVARWELVPTAIAVPGADIVSLSEEQTAGLLDALEQGTYQYAGSSTALQGCYARLFLWTSGRDHMELMFSEERVLVNTDFKGRGSPIYTITAGGGAVTGYIKDTIKAVYGIGA